MHKEQRMRDEATRAWAELDSLIMRMKIEENSAHHELEQLNEKLPQMLAEWSKGNVSREKVNKVKARIAKLIDLIGDMPVIIRELEKEKRQRCFRPIQDACLLSLEREKYNGLKEKMFDQYEPALAEELRRHAREIGEEEDCERFLAALSIETSKSRTS